jgi:hypothetical protein
MEPIEVEAPDGTIIEFPAGTDRATMQRVMQQRYGAPRGTAPAGALPAPQISQPTISDRQRRGQLVAQTFGNLSRDVRERFFPDPAAGAFAMSNPVQAVGLQDEALGLLSMAVGGDYEAARASEAQRIAQLRDEFPVSTTAGEVVSGGGAGMLAAPLIAARAPAGVQSFVANRPIVANGLLGGATGGAIGAAEGEGVQGRVVSGLLGATMGAPLGAAGTPIANRIAGAIGGAVERAPAGVRRLFGQGNAVPAAAPTQDGAFFGERLGPRGEQLITSIAQRPDQAGRVVQEAARDRALARTERVMAEVTQRIGTRRGVDVLIDSRAARKQAAPLFREAAAQPIEISGDVRARLRELDRLGVSFDVADRTIGRGGVRLSALVSDDVPEGGVVPLRALHQLVQDVEDAAGSAFRDERGNQGRALANEARGLRRLLKSTSPEFLEASALYAGQARDQRAFDLGQSAFQQGRNRARIELELNDFLGAGDDISASERHSFMAGVLDAIESATASTAAGGNAASRLTRQGIQDRLSIILGPEDARDLSRVLMRQTELSNLDRLYQPTLGSPTAARLSAQGAEDRLVSGPIRGGAASTLEAALDPAQTLRSARNAAVGAVRGRMSERDALELARVLVEQGDPTESLALQRFLRAIQQENVQRQSTVLPTAFAAGAMAGNQRDQRQ